jgi:hypothetical protein
MTVCTEDQANKLAEAIQELENDGHPDMAIDVINDETDEHVQNGHPVNSED